MVPSPASLRLETSNADHDLRNPNVRPPLATLTGDPVAALPVLPLAPGAVEHAIAWMLEKRLLEERIRRAREADLEEAYADEQLYRDAITVAGLSDEEAIAKLRSARPKPRGWKSALESDLPIERLEARNRELEQQAALEQRQVVAASQSRLVIGRVPAQRLRPSANRRERRPSCARRRGSRRVTRGSPCQDLDPGGDPEPGRGPLELRHKGPRR